MTRIAPWLSVADATGALAFYRAGFGAVELERMDDDDGNVVVAQLAIDGAEFWIQADPESNPGTLDGLSVRMIVTVDDPDAAFARAVAAGAVPVADVHDEHGWRTGRVVDPAGHHWELSRPDSG